MSRSYPPSLSRTRSHRSIFIEDFDASPNPNSFTLQPNDTSTSFLRPHTPRTIPLQPSPLASTDVFVLSDQPTSKKRLTCWCRCKGSVISIPVAVSGRAIGEVYWGDNPPREAMVWVLGVLYDAWASEPGAEPLREYRDWYLHQRVLEERGNLR
ncbi:hypothetical protein B0J18DRAFT_469136 [Chaetomium sp. MPI-SDFR-AT-0129]|nr:hypothetical protein B0J18DRAFT_469136 [Chaetomium sp. MPI-SDFR-AT-0129]